MAQEKNNTFKLQPNQIVKFREENSYGCTAAFQNRVAWVIYPSYCHHIEKFNDNLDFNSKTLRKNDIMAVYNVPESEFTECTKKIFNKRFNPEDYNLETVWKREE